jgi:hypothetical protein
MTRTQSNLDASKHTKKAHQQQQLTTMRGMSHPMTVVDGKLLKLRWKMDENLKYQLETQAQYG